MGEIGGGRVERAMGVVGRAAGEGLGEEVREGSDIFLSHRFSKVIFFLKSGGGREKKVGKGGREGKEMKGNEAVLTFKSERKRKSGEVIDSFFCCRKIEFPLPKRKQTFPNQKGPKKDNILYKAISIIP